MSTHPTTKWRRNGGGEAEVVHGAELAAILQRWADKYLEDRPRDRVAGRPMYVGPYNWLSQETGLHVRQIQGFMHAEWPHVALSKADALLQAIGTGERLDDDIQVIPNPRWSQEKWHDYMSQRGCV